MGIFQSDMAIKTAIELSLQDMKQNDWLLDDILSDCVNNPYLREKYGQKQIDAMKEWFRNNQIDVVMSDRTDKDRFPLVTITLGNSNEKNEMKTMADQSTETVTLYPQDIKKPIGYIVKPFTPISYSPDTGLLQVDPDTKNIETVVPGMIVVDPATGAGYIIQDVSNDGLYLEPDLTITADKLAVVPKFQYYTARREHTFFQETYVVRCYAHGDPQVLLWLWSIVLYSLLRYREAMLEAQGFSEVTISNGEMQQDPDHSSAGGEVLWVRPITLTGMTENSWIKQPRRLIESVAIREKTPSGYRGGIQVMSNSEPDTVEQQMQQNWFPINKNSDDSDE